MANNTDGMGDWQVKKIGGEEDIKVEVKRVGQETAGGKKNILIVEDDEVLLRALYMLFHKGEYSIATASDGDTALKMAQRIKPNLVLLDLLLPKMDGFGVLKAMKSDPKLKEIPVIILSNLGDQADIDKAKDLDADDYFVKADTDLSVLMEKIKKFLT